MKLFYSSIPVIFLFLIGCSSTSKITDYSSKEDFYKDINSSIKDRDVNVTTDSSFLCLKGSIIKDDYLVAITHIQEEKEKISLKDIKKIKYYGNAYEMPSAYIWLKNGKELKVDNVKIIPDSTIQFPNFITTNEYIPIFKVKKISYKTRWQGTVIGVPLGFLCGALIGGISGASGAFPHTNTGGNEPLTFDSETSGIVGAFWGSIIGTITGVILGYIIGWDHVYQFDSYFTSH